MPTRKNDPETVTLSVNVYARMAVIAGVERIDKRYRGTVDFLLPNAKGAIERLDEAKRNRIANTLSDLAGMSESDRTQYFIEAFRDDTDLASGLTHFNQLVKFDFDLLDGALKKAWDTKRTSLQREAAI